jgi:hypothetical protein
LNTKPGCTSIWLILLAFYSFFSWLGLLSTFGTGAAAADSVGNIGWPITDGYLFNREVS